MNNVTLENVKDFAYLAEKFYKRDCMGAGLVIRRQCE